MSKKLIVILLCLSMLFVVACSKDPNAQGNENNQGGEEEKVYKIALVANDATAAEWPKTVIRLLTEFQEEFSYELVVFDSQMDIGKQATLVGDAIAQGCDAIAIIPLDDKAIVPACTDAMNAGIPVFNLGSVELGPENAGVAFVSTIGAGDGRVASKMVGEIFVEYLEPGSKVVEIIGMAGTSEAEQRDEVWAQMCEEAGIEILDKQSTGWDVNKALEIMQNYLVKYPQIDGVFCQWDDGMASAIKALEAAGRVEGTVIASIDGNKNGFKLVEDGVSKCTVAQDLRGICRAAAETMSSYLKGEEVESYVTVTYIKITEDNISEYEPW